MAYVRKRNPEHDDEAATFTDEWLWFSDLCCGQVTSEEVAAAEPYICLYERT